MEKIITLADALLSGPEFDRDHALFIDREAKSYTSEMRCAMLDFESYDEPENPPFAVANNLCWGLHMDIVKDIVDNARQQLDQPSIDQLVQAFTYYRHNDAFIDFLRPKKQ